MSDSSDIPKPKIVIYESNWCGYCRAAKRLLEAKGWEYESRVVDGNASLRQEMTDITGRTSVPQIFFGDRHMGGFDDISSLDQSGELDEAYQSLAD